MSIINKMGKSLAVSTSVTKKTSSGGIMTTLLLPQKSMDTTKFLLWFLILLNVPSSDRGTTNNIASGTIIAISTSKGSVIMSTDGEEAPSSGTNVHNPISRRKWNQYETALSNTGLLGLDPLLQSLATTSTSTTTSTTTTTSSPLTPSLSSSESTDLPLLGSSLSPEGELRKQNSTTNTKVSPTFHVSFNNNNLLNNARKYIASYEDLQSRFPDGSPFENNTSINQTVPLGDTAFLRYRVRNLGERSISWIRRRDWHILTTGKTTYTNDERFNVLHVDGTEDWTLQIKFVQKRDNGTYECQVSTGTGIISYFVNLFIAVPEAFILGNGEYHVEQGSNINLVCVIEKSPKPPEFIFWYHNERMINYGTSREVVVRTEPGARTHSRLTIRDARITDSGNYTCKTAHADPASIFVYVSEASGLFSGDKMAAIQRRKTAQTTSTDDVDSTAPVVASASAATLTAVTTTTFPTTFAICVTLISFLFSMVTVTGSGTRTYSSSISLSTTGMGEGYFYVKSRNRNGEREMEITGGRDYDVSSTPANFHQSS